MKITLLQYDIVWKDALSNRQKVEDLMKSAERSDLYVLPEMFTSGFVISPEGSAEHDGSTVKWMHAMAKEYDAAICGSMAVAEDGMFFNRMYFVQPDGKISHYDKRHLFAYGGENLHYTNGKEPVTVFFRGVRFLLQICYDLRFPVFSRNNTEKLYDVALYVASWPASRLSVWRTLLHARAIENQCYVAGVNRVGKDETSEYSGGTLIANAYGRTVAECPDNAEATVSYVLDMDALMAFRKKFPVLADADK